MFEPSANFHQQPDIVGGPPAPARWHRDGQEPHAGTADSERPRKNAVDCAKGSAKQADCAEGSKNTADVCRRVRKCGPASVYLARLSSGRPAAAPFLGAERRAG